MATLPNRKHLLFYGIAIVIPIVVLMILELSLRVLAIGQPTPLFIPHASKSEYLQPNPKWIERYAYQKSQVPKVAPDSLFFKREKPKGQLRFVLIGGSTAAGFPYGRFGSIASELQQLIAFHFPYQPIEILPIAMSSINSYALRDIVDEVVDISPDAVLIYAGHNEYLGVMGVGSQYAGFGSHWMNLAFLAAKELHLFNALSAAITPFVGSPPVPSSTTVMASIAKDRSIEEGSDKYVQGLDQFTSNLDAILSTLTSAEIPVLISTLASNEHDQAPFSSVPAAPVSPPAAFLNNRMALPAKVEMAQHTVEKIPTSADAHYVLARLLIATDKAKAIMHFERAIALDGLRFRAPPTFNTIINEQAARFGATLVDSHAALRERSTQGVIGNPFMLEHLHPNAQGYQVIAQTFFAALRRSPLLAETKEVKEAALDVNLSLVSDVDERVATSKIATLMSAYPFTSAMTPVPQPVEGNDRIAELARQRLASAAWLDEQRALLSYYQQQQDWLSAAHTAARIALALPFEAQPSWIAARLYWQAQVPTLAVHYALRAYRETPHNEDIAFTYAEFSALLGNKAVAIEVLENFLVSHPQHVNAKHILEQLLQHKE